jgi:hypothetical protein
VQLWLSNDWSRDHTLRTFGSGAVFFLSGVALFLFGRRLAQNAA